MEVPVRSKKRVSRNIIGRRVREARNNFDPPLTQDQVSGRLARVGVQLDRVALAKVEGGLRCAFDFEVKGLAAVLNVDVSWLLGVGAVSASSQSGPTQRNQRRP